MRFLTYSFLKNCKLKTIFHLLPKKFSSNTSQNEIILEKFKGDPNLLEISPTWQVDVEQQLRADVMSDLLVMPNFITEREESSLLAELEPCLKRMRYEYDHWDNAIQGYRETERDSWTTENQDVLTRVRSVAFPLQETLPRVHVLDLAASGHIKPHVDAVRFCGDVIAGLCLCSSAVMRLEHSARPHLALHALLARRALYIMKGVARYSFSHAVLGGEASVWRGERVPRTRRVALITRAPPPTTPTLTQAAT